MSDELYGEIRPETKMDSLMSALTSIRFSEKISEWIDKQNETNKEFQESQQALDDAKNSKGRGKKQRIEQAEQNMQKAMQQKIKEQISKMMKESHERAKNTKEQVEALLAGNGRADLKNVPFKAQLELTEVLNKHPKLKEIAEWARRFKDIVRKKQKYKYQESMARTGVTVGNEIEQVLPSELLLYNHSSTRLDFLRRFAENQTLMFDEKGKESLGKGAIVCCLDQTVQ